MYYALPYGNALPIKDDIEAAVKLELQERRELEFVSCNETQNSEAK
jgi:hypothetical protein